MRASASKFALLEHCGYFARPDVNPPREPPKVNRDAGSALQALVNHASAPDRFEEPSLDHLPKAVREEVRVTFDAYLGSDFAQYQWEPEVGFAYDTATDTARRLTMVHQRDYSSLRPGEVPGTPDAVYFDDESNGVLVADFKFGDGNAAREELSRGQRDFNVLAAARAFGATQAIGYIVHLMPGGPRVFLAGYDAAELAAIARRVARAVASIPDAEPRPGPHCHEMWCPARPVCPAGERALLALAPGEPLRFAIERDDQAAALWTRIAVIRAACDAAEDAAKTYAREHDGFELGDGRRLTPCQEERDSIDLEGNPAALAVLPAGAAVPTATKASIERALRASGLKGKELAAQVEGVVNNLRSVGAVTTKVSEMFRPKRIGNRNA